MSKKTEELKAELSRLRELKDEISVINEFAKSGVFNDEEAVKEQFRHLRKIENEMELPLAILEEKISSLYGMTGKSKSHAKQAASKENGRKGGRPRKVPEETQ